MEKRRLRLLRVITLIVLAAILSGPLAMLPAALRIIWAGPEAGKEIKE